jgi:hypothetical protein
MTVDIQSAYYLALLRNLRNDERYVEMFIEVGLYIAGI